MSTICVFTLFFSIYGLYFESRLYMCLLFFSVYMTRLACSQRLVLYVSTLEVNLFEGCWLHFQPEKIEGQIPNFRLVKNY
jgi:hypothetical protein